MLTRTTETASIIIQLPNATQPPNGLPVVATYIDTIKRGPDLVGYPQQRQQHLIPADITPDLLATINEQLATIGYQLTPTEAAE